MQNYYTQLAAAHLHLAEIYEALGLGTAPKLKQAELDLPEPTPIAPAKPKIVKKAKSFSARNEVVFYDRRGTAYLVGSIPKFCKQQGHPPTAHSSFRRLARGEKETYLGYSLTNPRVKKK